MRRVFVMGDIHGAYRALRQCLQTARFDFNNDHLICLGDVSDGWPETKACIDELRRIKNLTYILGNHDWWTLQWMLSGIVEDLWYVQGGKATIDSYPGGVPTEHLTFLSDAVLHHTYENKLFVHAGIDPHTPLHEQDQNTFLWDRALASMALNLYPHSTHGNLSQYDSKQHVSHPVRCNFTLRYVACVGQGLGKAMIAREHVQLAAPQEERPGIADVPEEQVSPSAHRHGHRRSHTGELRVAAGLLLYSVTAGGEELYSTLLNSVDLIV
jgi:serine/threonine protein phosphatase 1